MRIKTIRSFFLVKLSSSCFEKLMSPPLWFRMQNSSSHRLVEVVISNIFWEFKFWTRQRNKTKKFIICYSCLPIIPSFKLKSCQKTKMSDKIVLYNLNMTYQQKFHKRDFPNKRNTPNKCIHSCCRLKMFFSAISFYL